MFDPGPEPVSEPGKGVAAGEAWPDEAWEVEADLAVPSWWEMAERDREFVPSAVELLAEARRRGPGAGQLSRLVGLDVAALSADDAVTVLQEIQRFQAYAAGVETELRARVTQRVVAQVAADFAAEAGRREFVFPEQVAHSEISAAMRWSPRTGESRILEAEELTGTWRPLLAAMLAGSITIEHTRAIGRQLRNLPGYGDGDPQVQAAYATSCAKILARVVPFAATHTPGEAGRKTRVLVTAEDPDGARARRRTAAERQHGVFLNPVEPGTCEVRAVLPTAYAEAIHQAVRTLAKDRRFEVADGCITAGQRQAAALVALTLGDPGSVATVTGPVAEAKLAVHVNVLVPIESLVGQSEQGGRIGTTPVTADEVRDLIADAALGSSTIRRLVTDSAGCILDAGRRHYLASDLQKLVLMLRDGTCRFPGCTEPAHHCEIDHATSYGSGGRTDPENLGPLCKYHHLMKTHAGWDIIASHRDGSCTWRSPLGRIYQHTPPDLVPPPPRAPDHDPPPF